MSLLFDYFKNINTENFDFVDDLTDDEVKSISAYVLLGWMHGAEDNTEAHVMLTDLYCNDFVFNLSDHPRLLLKLFIAANGGIDNTRYKYVKSKSANKSSNVMKVAKYYNITYNEAMDRVLLMTEDQIKRVGEMVDESQ